MNTGEQLPRFTDDDKNKKNVVRPVFIVLVIATMLMVFFYPQYADRNTVSTESISPEELSIEFKKVVSAPGSSTNHQTEITVKSSSIRVSNRYVVPASAQVVLQHYKDQLLQNQWAYRRTFSNGRQWGDGYCKGAMGGSVEIIFDEVGKATEYEFSISVNSVSRRDCEK